MIGGFRVPLKLKRSDQLLIAAIIDKNGGPTAIAEKYSTYWKTTMNAQAPINWRIRGQVPKEYIKKLAECLRINSVGLAYATLVLITDDAPPWEDVVRSYGLGKDKEDKILMLKPPGFRK